MEEFIGFWRRRLAIHGAFLFLIGLALGAGFAIQGGGGLTTDPLLHRWRVAHQQGLSHGFLLFGLAAAFPYFGLSRRFFQLAGWSVVVGAWAAVVSSFIAANFEVDGRSWLPDGWNRIAFLLFALGVFGTTFSLLLIVLRAAWDALHEGLFPTTWRNWAKLVSARPRSVPEPGDLPELLAAVQSAIDEGMPVRAFGARASWNAMATSHGMMIDMYRLKKVLAFAPSNPLVPAAKGTVKVEAGIPVGELSKFLAEQNQAHTLENAPVIPWAQVGGALAMGCHGTGQTAPYFPEQVVQLQVVQDVAGVATLQTYNRPGPLAPVAERNRWNALLVSLGALGVFYSVTFECVKMFRVRHRDVWQDMETTIKTGLPALVTHKYAEVFWFPYDDLCWVKTWDQTNAPLQGLPWWYWFVQWSRNRFLGTYLFHVLSLVPWLTPLFMKFAGLLVPHVDRVLLLPDALHYQRTFTKAVDMGYAIPYDQADPNLGFERVKMAWFAVVDRLAALRHEGIYPQNLVLHARFVGPSEALIAPSVDFPFTCYIEILTALSTPRYEEYFEVVEREWLRLGGRPHWGKLTFHPERIRDAYPKPKMDTFLAVRKQLDPNCVFLNDYLREVLHPEEG